MSFNMAANVTGPGKSPEVVSKKTEEPDDTTVIEEYVEGERMRSFRMCIKRCVDKVIGAGRIEKFNSTFRKLRAQNPEAFNSITEQLMNHLRTNIETEVELMIKQEHLAQLLNELDKINEIQQALSNESCIGEIKEVSDLAWRPCGIPSSDCRDHVMGIKPTYRDQLKTMMEQIEKENELLKEQVLPRREKLIEKERLLTQKSNDLGKAAEFCQSFDLKNLEEQATKALHN